jgi:flagellar biosynthesis protein FliQ
MTEHYIIDIGSQSIWIALQIAAPALITTLVIGILVSIFQAATQINEQTLSFIPKIVAMTIALVATGPWILETMIGFTVGIFKGIPNIGR